MREHERHGKWEDLPTDTRRSSVAKIPEHLGGGSKLPEPLPKRPAEDRTCPGTIYFIAKMKGDRIEMYDWMPKTDPLPVLQEHVQRLQIAAPKGQKFMLIGYVMSEAYEAR